MATKSSGIKTSSCKSSSSTKQVIQNIISDDLKKSELPDLTTICEHSLEGSWSYRSWEEPFPTPNNVNDYHEDVQNWFSWMYSKFHEIEGASPANYFRLMGQCFHEV